MSSIWRKDSEDVGGAFRNNVNSFVMGISVVFAWQQDAYMRTPSADLFVIAVRYFMMAAGAIVVNTILKNHILDSASPPVGIVAFRAFYYIFSAAENFYIFLLVNLIKEVTGRVINEDEWSEIHLMPIVFIVVVYYLVDEMRRTFLSPAQALTQKEITNRHRRTTETFMLAASSHPSN